jgi:hypothetical protein
MTNWIKQWAFHKERPFRAKLTGENYAIEA